MMAVSGGDSDCLQSLCETEEYPGEGEQRELFPWVMSH